MPPTPLLVIADGPFKTYPGRVIALRAIDWMGAARGTLTSEVAPLAATGTAVRDSQQVTTSIRSSGTNAFIEANDTLTIPFANLPLETHPSFLDMTYRVLVSVWIEGDWDPTDVLSTELSNQHRFTNECRLGIYGDAFSATEALRDQIVYQPRLREHYALVSIGTIEADRTSTLHLRAYAQDGSTIVWHIDQIILLPFVFSGTKLGAWTTGDFRAISPSLTLFESLTPAMVDGADGGDDNGKFTWAPYASEGEYTQIEGDDGGGDYQQKASEAASEYMVRIDAENGLYYLANTFTSPDTAGPAHLYSAHGTNFRESNVWTRDEFSRTTGGTLGSFAWGLTPEGYGWRIRGYNQAASLTAESTMAVDGSEGVMFIRNTSLNTTGGMEAQLLTGLASGEDDDNPLGASIAADNLIFSGKLRFLTGPATVLPPTGSSPQVIARGRLFQSTTPTTDYWVEVDFLDASWSLVSLPGNGTIHGPVDISSWFALEESVSFKIEVRRYLLRAKVWQTSAGEPGTWDYEDFRELAGIDYPYADDLNDSITERDVHSARVEFFVAGVAGGMGCNWDDLQVEVLNPGTPTSVFASVEQPDQGAVFAEKEIPWGAWHLVYWGARLWTDEASWDPGVPYLDFAGKAWNEVGAPELQRAEAQFYYFRSVHGPIISMNWRWADRQGVARRVLVGTRRP